MNINCIKNYVLCSENNAVHCINKLKVSINKKKNSETLRFEDP